MTVQEFKALLLTIDPNAKHFYWSGGGNYTVWAEYSESYLIRDDKIASKDHNIQVDRYTKLEYDPMVDLLTAGFDIPEIVIRPRRIIYETNGGYVHHIWDLVLIDG